MTETEWLECSDSWLMIEQVEKDNRQRKLRLFAAACCRRAWHLSTDARVRNAVEAIESYLEGEVSAEFCQRASDDAFKASLDHADDNMAESLAFAASDAANLEPDCGLQAFTSVGYAATFMAGHPSDQARQENRKVAWNSEKAAQAALIHDIFGNPFRPVTLDPRWLTSTVLDLARTIYDERAFERMPILADALMDAGCDSEEIIKHCQGPGPHVRGCWVVDLLLAKE